MCSVSVVLMRFRCCNRVGSVESVESVGSVGCAPGPPPLTELAAAERAGDTVKGAHLTIKILLGSNPLNSRILVRRLAVL